mmetsp:Transcript_97864/g.299055  ORF Transcript_97864/g.299055 Transcript_97864/m.299055 type:complete len:210 (-) Transcript_97864:418-1047(-)
MNWKRPDKEITCMIARPMSSGSMRPRTAPPPKVEQAMTSTTCTSRRKPKNLLVMSHQNQARPFCSRIIVSFSCAASSRPKARMQTKPRIAAAKYSKIGDLLTLSSRLSSVIDRTAKLRNRAMYQHMAQKTGITGGTVMQTSTIVPAPVQPKSKTSCNAWDSKSSTCSKSPLNRLRIRPCGFSVKKARRVPSTCCKAALWMDEDARKFAK